MIDLKLDENHDLEITDDLQLIEGRLEVLQSTKITILFIQLEWVFNYTLGIPWLTDMFDIEFPQIQKRKFLVVNITQVLGVRQLTAFEYNVDNINKGGLVSFEAETTFGPIKQTVSV